MKENITTELSNALKNGDKERIHTLRLVLAAIKDKEIASRSSGEDSTISDDTVISLLKKMVKQRTESIEIYKKNNRSDLLEVEQKEHDILCSFLPKQLSDDDTKKICEQTISSLGATSIKDMGKIMGELKKQHADEIDFAKAGPLIRELLNK